MDIILYRTSGGKLAVGLTALKRLRTIDVFPIILKNRKSEFDTIPSYLAISDFKLSKMRFFNIIHIEPSQIEKTIFEIDYDDFIKICDRFNYR